MASLGIRPVSYTHLHLLKDSSLESVLVFTRTKHGADKVARVLAKANIGAEAIHGNKSQTARQRALTNFCLLYTSRCV